MILYCILGGILALQLVYDYWPWAEIYYVSSPALGFLLVISLITLIVYLWPFLVIAALIFNEKGK